MRFSITVRQPAFQFRTMALLESEDVPQNCTIQLGDFFAAGIAEVSVKLVKDRSHWRTIPTEGRLIHLPPVAPFIGAFLMRILEIAC